MKKDDFVRFVKSINEKERDWESRHLWVAAIVPYLFLLCLFSSFFYCVFIDYNLFHTDAESARYMLSALVQSQAAIVAIVVSLTVIAVQLTASAYSPRVIDIFKSPKKNPDFWILLGFYGFSIFYGLFLLKLVEGGEGDFVSQSTIWSIGLFSISLESGVSFAYWLGAFTFGILFLYMWNILNLMKIENIINRLAEDITKYNLLNSKEDPVQPIMDIVHGSIMKYDIATTRVGLGAVTEQVIEIIDSDGEEKISGRFCKHLERVGGLAVSKTDEESTAEVIENLEVFGKSTAEKRLQGATGQTAEFLYTVGVTAAEKGLAGAAGRAVESLEAVGVTAAEKRLENATPHVALYLGHFGKSTAEKGYNYTTKQTVWSLGAVGKVAAEKGLENATKQVALSLGDIGTAAVKKGLKDVTNQAALSLAELTILSEETVKDDIQNYEESILKKQDRVAFQKFMKIYEQELEKLRAEK